MINPDLLLQVHARADAPAAAACAASLVTEECRRAVAERGVFTLALSGGSTPVLLFRLLREAALKGGGPAWIDWARVRVFWADERCVPPDHAASNYALACRELLNGLPHSPKVFRMRGEDEPSQTAAAYEADLRALAGTVGDAVPRLDCVLLGMGADGHTASLFPGSPALAEKERLTAVTEGPDPGTQGGKLCRLTLTLPTLNAARCCLILACGREKHAPLRRALDLCAPSDLPVQAVRPFPGRLVWIADAAALTP